MLPKKTAAADAWDDDWESLADVRLPHSVHDIQHSY